MEAAQMETPRICKENQDENTTPIDIRQSLLFVFFSPYVCILHFHYQLLDNFSICKYVEHKP